MSTNQDSLSRGLVTTLSAFLPTRDQTTLLQACLWSGERGKRAWAQWIATIDDPINFLREDKHGVKGLLSLLFHSLQNNCAAVEAEFGTYLRTSYFRDALRSQKYGQICRDVVTALSAESLPAVVLKGAALAETCYEHPGLQHAHYLELLIEDSDIDRAVETLHRIDFTGSDTVPRSPFLNVTLVHSSGLPLLLHRRLFRFPFYKVPMEAVWQRSLTQDIAGAPTRVLNPADNLLHICGSVFDADHRDSLRSACDAWFLIQRHSDLHWKMLLESARESRMALPLFLTGDYLARSLEAPIPAWFLEELKTAACKGHPAETRGALFSAQVYGRCSTISLLQKSADWTTRRLLLKWAIFPPPSYLRWSHEVRSSWLLPVYYIYRPFRFAIHLSLSLCRRVIWRLRRSVKAVRTTCERR